MCELRQPLGGDSLVRSAIRCGQCKAFLAVAFYPETPGFGLIRYECMRCAGEQLLESEDRTRQQEHPTPEEAYHLFRKG